MAALGPCTIVVVIGTTIARADLPDLCKRLRLLLQHTDDVVVACDVSALTGVDAVTVDGLARLQLTARRLGCQIQLRHASCELRQLLAFAGLAEVVPLERGLRVGWPGGQTKQREQARRVEKGVEADDSTG